MMRTDWVLCWIHTGGQWRLLFMLGSLCFPLKAVRAEYAGIDPT